MHLWAVIITRAGIQSSGLASTVAPIALGIGQIGVIHASEPKLHTPSLNDWIIEGIDQWIRAFLSVGEDQE